MNVQNFFTGVAALGGAILIAACSSEAPKHEEAPPAASAPAATAAAPAASAKRVFFVEPADGATVKSPVHLKFGSEGISIMPVPAEVTTVREGVGHYHLGVEADCLPAGTEIVKGTPTWVHFGKGDDVFDLQLAPGQHKLALQIGDDKHVTMPGFCSTITLNVTQ
jgi:hypothetical protein